MKRAFKHLETGRAALLCFAAAVALSGCAGMPEARTGGPLTFSKSEGKVLLASPQGTIRVQLLANAGGTLQWSVARQGMVLLSPAPIGITIDGRDLGKGVSFGTPEVREIREQYPTFGNHATATNHCNEAIIPVTVDGATYRLDVRAFDDGAAVRMRMALDETPHDIAGEATAWAVPANSQVWWSRYDNSYENPHQTGTFEALPANTNLNPPITFKTPDGVYVALTEANNEGFPDMGLARDGATLKAVFPASARGWKHQGPLTTPWRVALIADNLNALVNSDIVTNLCPPPPAELANASWIKPGRSLWQWWAIGAPKLEDQKQWVDAAKRLGFEYYLIDDGWRTWRAEGKDQWQLLKEVIDYGKSQGVQSLVWVNSNEMRTAPARRAYLERVAALGAAGIKIDFIPAATADIMKWYEGALKDTAELKLLCNFHGAVKPTGRRRTWPHELTRESVRGLEYHMTRYRRVLPAGNDETVLFTRYLAGPADFTPTTFDPVQLNGYTASHMLAQAVTMTSPILHFGGGYRDFLDNPAEDFLRHLPSTWDETVVLPGSEIGKTAGFARRRGQDWFIGIVNGGTAASLEIDLRFLSENTYRVQVFADDPANAAGFKQEARAVTAKDSLSATMAARGGYVAWIRKETR